MCRSIPLVAKATILAILALLAIPQTSEAQYFFGRGGVYFPVGQRSPYAIPGFFGPAYGGFGNGGYGGYFGGGSFAYASAYSSSNATPIIINNNYFTMPGVAQSAIAVNPATEVLANPTPGIKAAIDVIVPADAELWFDGAMTQLKGETRSFLTPSLAAGSYSYEIRATWKDPSGKEVARTRLIQVSPGQQLTVNFVTGTQDSKKLP